MTDIPAINASVPFRDYEQVLAYLYQHLPMFQRVGAPAFKKDLTNTIRLCQFLENPQNKIKAVHIAGTNGKGSVSHMTAAALQSAGYKTGLYTSPHLNSFTERIRINGAEMSQGSVVDFMNLIAPVITEIKPSFFEITVAMALWYFDREAVDIAVVEVGMGGCLDSTNVVRPVACCITNISLEHQEFLGDTLEAIAGEKAGIIKQRVPVVISEWHEETFPVFKRKSEACNAELIPAFEQWCAIQGEQGMDVFEGQDCILTGVVPFSGGDYQLKNIPAVVALASVLAGAGFMISKQSLKKGIEATHTLTGLKGRWQILSEHPLTIADTAHNLAGLSLAMNQLKKIDNGTIHFVMGFTREKKLGDIIPIFPVANAKYYFCEANIPRAMPSQTVKDYFEGHGIKGEAIPEVNAAIMAATSNAAPGDIIFITGSIFIIAEVENL